MSRRAARVTQTEAENVIRAFEATGKRAVEMRILPDGTIIVISERGRSGETTPPSIIDAMLDEAERD